VPRYASRCEKAALACAEAACRRGLLALTGGAHWVAWGGGMLVDPDRRRLFVACPEPEPEPASWAELGLGPL